MTTMVLMSTDYVAGKILNLSHLILISYLQLSNHWPHFTDKEIEIEKLNNLPTVTH